MLFFYIDPGTGSLLGSVAIGLSLALLYYLRGLFYRLLNALTGRRSACDGDFSGKLVFFSEGRNYWPVFRPVCEELLKKQHDFVYLTAGADDPGLEQLPAQQAVYLGKLVSAIYTMNHLRARLCVMTTPQLDIMQLKRSAGVAHYCHIMHSPSDVHTYEKFAFDHFDSVLCTSQYVLDNLRFLERRRQTDYMRKKGLVRPRKLLKTGCPYYQNYFLEKPNKQNKHKNGETPCVLLASSWGERSFLNKIELILNELLLLSCRVIFRPHPQAWTSDTEVLEWVEKQYRERIQIDRELDNRPAMAEADVLVCDISGIIYDFAFIYEKPILALVQGRVETMGYESADLNAPDAAFTLLDDVGAVLSIDHWDNQKDCEEMGRILPQVLRKQVSRAIIDKHVFHFDCAGRVAAEQILELYRD